MIVAHFTLVMKNTTYTTNYHLSDKINDNSIKIFCDHNYRTIMIIINQWKYTMSINATKITQWLPIPTM